MGNEITRPRRGRRFLFNLLMALGTVFVIEAVAYVCVTVFLGSPQQLAEKRLATAQQEPFVPGGHFEAPGVIHPYIGAVLQPKNDHEPYFAGKYRITEFGFIDDSLPIHQRSPSQVIVAILGGSVARQLSMNASETIAQELSQSPEFAGKEIRFVRLASNGYKQPQQLMVMNYLFALGAEFDIVINLDGFNEAVLPEVDNINYGVNSAYPRNWGKLIAGHASPEFVRMGGYVSYLRMQQRDDARFFSRAPLRYSPTALLIWTVRKNRSDDAMGAQLALMSRFTETERTYCGSGPPEHFKSSAEMFDHCIALWSRSSLLLQQLCAARGIRYYHFLQPNQYFQGSKPIGPAEAAVALEEGSQHCIAVRTCFPQMQVEGRRLRDQGVAFTDLTQIFADHPEQLYMDACCHVVEAGDVLLAKAIAGAILQSSRPAKR